MAESSQTPTLTLYDAETLLPWNEDGIPYLQFEQIKRVGLAEPVNRPAVAIWTLTALSGNNA